MATRHQHGGLFKVCGCPRRTWPKCPHSYRLAFRYQKGKHHRLALDKIAGRHLSKTEATTEADRVKTEIRAGRWGASAPVLPTLTLAALLDTYERDVLAKRPGGTRPNATYQMSAIVSADLRLPTGEMRRFSAWHVSDVTTAALEQFRAVRQVATPVTRAGRGARTVGGPKGVNRALSFLRSVFNWAIRAGYVERTPFKRGTETVIKLSRESKRTRRLQEGEDDRLLPTCGPHLRAVVECALETGMRRGEILGLQWSEVALHAGELRLTPEKTKTRNGRTIPISSRLRAILTLRQHGPDGEPHPLTAYVFGNEIGQRVGDIKAAWLGACARIGIADLHFHDLRREAGSRWLDGGVPLHVVRDWLGHTSVAQTSTYLATTTKSARDAMQRFELHRSGVQQNATEGETRGQTGPQSPVTSNSNPQENTAEHGPH